MVWQIDLSGKCIVVTGGNRGIGLAISEQCAQAGAHVAMIYRSASDADEVAAKVAEKYDVRCQAFKCDVMDKEAMAELLLKIYQDVGPVGGIVCNAGVNIRKPALEMTREDFDNQLGPNVWGVLSCAQAAAALWKKHDYKDGRIVIVSSVCAHVAVRGASQCLYNTSKGALTMLAKSLAEEWADQGILVNTLSPGFVDTDMNQNLRDDEKLNKGAAGLTALNRISKPHEQAGAVLFFLSEYATYATGAEMIVDGA